jgi:hypothetical protein
MLKRVPTMGLNDSPNDLAAALQDNPAPANTQFFSGNSKNAVAFAEGGPVQSVGLIQKDLMVQCGSIGAL